jgi:dihydrofolate reductase
MGKLVYGMIASLDGYVVDAAGRFDWAMPDEEVHAFANDLEREAGTHLYGRRMYETMAAWETMPLEDEPEVMREFAAGWRGADKVVYSRTLPEVTTSRTRLEREFDADAVRRLKSAADPDLSIGGPGLAAAAFRAGLVDESWLILAPVAVGGGTRVLPDDVRIDLELLDVRRFGNGMVYLRHRVR